MRGKLPRVPRRNYPTRNIPAYAGKTRMLGYSDYVPEEHPRVCGENLCGKLSLIRGEGTSPRMRGKLPGATSSRCWKRNIPAYAGKTGKQGYYLLGKPEHPRVCGENDKALSQRSMAPGTSPHMRGKRIDRLKREYGKRNIPAYAGKTSPPGYAHQ